MFSTFIQRQRSFLNVFIGLITLIVFTPSALAAFTDVPKTHRFYNEINALQEKGTLKGYPDGSFQPEKSINRAEFTTLVFRDLGYTPPANIYETGFKDVANTSWFAPFVKRLLEMKIVIVDPEYPYFSPTSNITRLNAYQLIFPLHGVPAPLLISPEKSSFTDLTGTEPWYYLAIAAEKSGVLVPDTYFSSQRTVTRGEAAYLIYKANEYRNGKNQPINAIPTDDLLSELGNLNDTEIQLIQHPKFPVLLHVWNKINSQYINKDEVDQTELIYGAIHGMVESLEDTYSVFLDPEDASSLTQFFKGSYEGIGLLIDKFEGNFIVINTLKDSPADKAGIQPGDYIIKINGENIKDYSLEEVIFLLQGASGTSVDITIKRDSTTKTYKLTRTEIIEKTVAYPHSAISIPSDIAYIAIYQFIDTTGTEFEEALESILEKDPKGLILDLRNNPGGYVDTAYEVLEQFIVKDKILAQIKSPEKTIKELSKATDIVIDPDLPIVVLVNKNTASAGEIVAAALQDHKIAKLIGETTFGKGTVQEVNMYEDGALFKITIAQWLTPLGKDINGEGLTPNIIVNPTKDDILGNTDSQLSRAINELEKSASP